MNVALDLLPVIAIPNHLVFRALAVIAGCENSLNLVHLNVNPNVKAESSSNPDVSCDLNVNADVKAEAPRPVAPRPCCKLQCIMDFIKHGAKAMYSGIQLAVL